MLSHVWLFCDPMDCSPKDSPSMGFPRQEYWNGLPFPPLGDILDPGIQPVSLALAGGCFSTEPPGRPMLMLVPFYLYWFTLSPLSWFQKLPWIPSLGEVPVLTPQHPVYNSNSARHQNGLWMCLSMPLAEFKLLEERGMNFHPCRHTMVSTMCNARLHICWSLILITMDISSLSVLMGHNTHCQQLVRWWELTVCGKEYVIDGRLFRTFCEWKLVGGISQNIVVQCQCSISLCWNWMKSIIYLAIHSKIFYSNVAMPQYWCWGNQEIQVDTDV